MTRSKYELKVVITGDGATGKTAILTRYVDNKFTENYKPTIFENFIRRDVFNNTPIDITLWDTAGQEGYEHLRKVSYNADVYIICFCTIQKSSLDNVIATWSKELGEYDPGKPIVLVGTKSDLKNDPKYKNDAVTLEDVRKVESKIGSTQYVECSSKTGANISDIFNGVMQAGLPKKYKKLNKDKNCSIF
eukprot:GAHX01001065.1.p1 GENE.GAHX01001065.1~~GAHX01001065.1.p1  ORF type:complete len:190 (+),score=30.78 GAHX01001065.1:41-610(+)